MTLKMFSETVIICIHHILCIVTVFIMTAYCHCIYHEQCKVCVHHEQCKVTVTLMNSAVSLIVSIISSEISLRPSWQYIVTVHDKHTIVTVSIINNVLPLCSSGAMYSLLCPLWEVYRHCINQLTYLYAFCSQAVHGN